MAADKRPDDFQARLDGFAQRSGCGPGPDPDRDPDITYVTVFSPSDIWSLKPRPVGDIGPGSDAMQELLKRTRILNGMLMKYLGTHPALAYDPAWGPLVAQAREALYKLYQQVGAAHAEGLEPGTEEHRDASTPIPPWRHPARAADPSAFPRPDERDPADPDPDRER